MVRQRSSGAHAAATGALLIGLLVGLLSCTPTEPAEGALLNPDGTAVYTDGTYLVSYSHLLPDGWRPYVQVHIRAGLIDRVCFDAAGSAGSRLRADESYAELVRLATGRTPEAVLDALETGLIERQAFPVSVPVLALDEHLGLAGAFGALAQAALARARSGDHAPSEINAGGPYVLEDRPDELGWKGRMAVAFSDQTPVAVSFAESRRGADGEVRYKSSDPGYTEAYERVMGLTSAGVEDDLVARFLETGTGDPGAIRLDAVSGASATTGRFTRLATALLSSRRTEALPGKLCSD